MIVSSRFSQTLGLPLVGQTKSCFSLMPLLEPVDVETLNAHAHLLPLHLLPLHGTRVIFSKVLCLYRGFVSVFLIKVYSSWEALVLFLSSPHTHFTIWSVFEATAMHTHAQARSPLHVHWHDYFIQTYKYAKENAFPLSTMSRQQEWMRPACFWATEVWRSSGEGPCRFLEWPPLGPVSVLFV